MTDEESLRLVSQFWVPFVTIVPVIAVAYIFEARLIASMWTFKHKWVMAAQGVFVTGGGLALIYLEVKALWSIVYLSFDLADVSEALALLSVIMVAVIGYPIVHIYIIAINPVVEIGTSVVMTPLTWLLSKVGKKATARVGALEEKGIKFVEQTDQAIEAELALETKWAELLNMPGDLDPKRTALIRSQLDERATALAELRQRREAGVQMLEEVRARRADLAERLSRLTEYSSLESANRRAKTDLERSVEKFRRMR